MRGANGDKHAGFTDLEVAEAVENRHAVDGVGVMQVRADFAHLGERHGFVGFIFQIEGAASVGFIAHEAIECDDGAILIGAHVVYRNACVNRRSQQFAPVVGGCRGHRELASTSADRRKKGNVIASGKRRLPGSKLLVAGSDEGRAKAGKGWKAALVAVEQVGQRGTLGDLDGLFRDSGQLPDSPEEQHLHTQIWRDARHREIVT